MRACAYLLCIFKFRAYDLNGNILAMTQRGLYNSANVVIDQLSYSYKKGSRYIDVRGTKSETGETKDIQVGRQNKNKTPVKRERDAMNDIQRETGRRPDFRPYN